MTKEWLMEQSKCCLIMIIFMGILLIPSIIGIFIIPDSNSIDKLFVWGITFLAGIPFSIFLLLLCIYLTWYGILKFKVVKRI